MELKINEQPAEKPTEDPELEWIDCYQTLQGEGPLAGTPAIFVRLAGCNLQCPLCDTQYTEGRQKGGLLEKIYSMKKNFPSNLVVITGGEPLRQGAIVGLVLDLQKIGYQVQIETNGTIYRNFTPPIGWSCLTVVCSPKTETINEKFKKEWEFKTHNFCYKYILSADHVSEVDGLPTCSLGMKTAMGRPMLPARPSESFPRDRIFVQPLDDRGSINWADDKHFHATVKSCMKYGYRLSLQTHKLLGLP